MNGLIGLIDDALPPSRLTAQADALGLRLEPSLECMPTVTAPCLVIGKATPARVKMGLALPARGFIEWTTAESAQLPRLCVECAALGGVVIALNSRAAYEWDITNLIIRSLALRFPQLSPILGDIELATAEAVANAIIHGNLEIGSTLRNDVRGFTQFQATLLERLDDKDLNSRRIEIAAIIEDDRLFTLTVTDQGSGYDFEKQLTQAAHKEAKSGRGLGLIRQLATHAQCQDGGRHLRMDFAIPPSG